MTLRLRAVIDGEPVGKRLDLPTGVDEESATAKYKNGVQEMTFDRLDRDKT